MGQGFFGIIPLALLGGLFLTATGRIAGCEFSPAFHRFFSHPVFASSVLLPGCSLFKAGPFRPNNSLSQLVCRCKLAGSKLTKNVRRLANTLHKDVSPMQAIPDDLDEAQPWYLRPENKCYVDLLVAIFYPKEYRELQELRREETIRGFSS